MDNDTKISASHLSRNAYIYIRQSTEHQVRNNIESKQRQYELVNLVQNPLLSLMMIWAGPQVPRPGEPVLPN